MLILIYGSSIILDSLAQCLQRTGQVRVQRCWALGEVHHLAQVNRVLVDLNDPATRDVLSLARIYPRLQVIGIDDRLGKLMVLSSQEVRVRSVEEIVALLLAQSI